VKHKLKQAEEKERRNVSKREEKKEGSRREEERNADRPTERQTNRQRDRYTYTDRHIWEERGFPLVVVSGVTVGECQS